MKNFIFTMLIFAAFSGCAAFRADYHTVSKWSDCEALAQKEGWKLLAYTERNGHIPLIEPLGADAVCYPKDERECATINQTKCYTDRFNKTTCQDSYTACSQKVKLYKKP
ncbi:MAG: hypothetical protein J6M14_01480 [Campylobacter sp.]|nr:hypothetical protein [Campylobacter sp.]